MHDAERPRKKRQYHQRPQPRKKKQKESREDNPRHDLECMHATQGGHAK